jgi:hypothetical protein
MTAVDKATYNRIRRTSQREGRDAENDRITKLLREPSKELITFVALAIRDSQLGPARAAIGAVCDWIKND